MTQLGLFTNPEPQPEPSAAGAAPDCGDAIRRSILATTLQAAVPLWIERAQQWPDDGLRAGVLGRWRDDALDTVAHRGDNILYAGTRRGDTAGAFNQLAKGMAALAHHPGGYVAFGLVWCAEHSPGGVVANDGLSCRVCLAEERPRLAAIRQRLVTLVSALADQRATQSDRIVGEG